MIRAGQVGRRMEVGHERFDVFHQRPLPRRTPMAEVIRGVDNRTEADKHRRHMVVATGMLAIAVGDQGHESRRLLARPRGDVNRSGCTIELATAAGHSPSLPDVWSGSLARPDPACRPASHALSTARRAAMSGWRR